MDNKIMTVCGPINADSLGVTLTHEHLLIDVRNWLLAPPPGDPFLKNLAVEKVNIKNRGELVYYCCYSIDNMHQLDINISIEEALKFKALGGSTIVDLTLDSIGRNPDALFNISANTGLNIVMGTGYYVESSWSAEEKGLPVKILADSIVKEFYEGIGRLKIKPGIIGEIGISDINNMIEVKGLEAAAIAQKEIECAINVHMPIWEKDGHKILDFLENKKVNLNKVILSHCDPTLDDPDYPDSLAKRGAYIEYDEFGMELMTPELRFLPSDGERIRAIFEQIRRGNLERILISHDIDTKICLSNWGGFGCAHILRHIKPRMENLGVSKEYFDIITIENPKRILSFC